MQEDPTPGPQGDPPADPPSDPKPNDPKPNDPKPDDAVFARLRRDKDAADKRAQEAERKLADRERKEAEDKGEWEKLAKQSEQERDEARRELTADRRRMTVAEVARELKFIDPEDVIGRVGNDVEDRAALKRELKKIAEQKPYLIESEQPPRGLAKVLENGEVVAPGQAADVAKDMDASIRRAAGRT